MQKEKTCSFTGHRTIEDGALKPLQKALEKHVNQLISEGITCFASGGALGFDLLAANTVLRLKKKHPHIKLVMVLPCREQDKFWNRKQKEQYQSVLASADEILYTSDSYYIGCMQKRNRYLVDCASCLLAYLLQDAGGTKYTVDYAEKTGTKVTFLQAKPKRQLSLFD